jgi:PhoPQ-activated pathogenicity-related protein
MLIRLIKVMFFGIFLIFSELAIADLQCDQDSLYNKPSQILSCYMLNYQKPPSSEMSIIDGLDTHHPEVMVRTIKLNSQLWQETDPNHGVWQHTLKIYIPEKVNDNAKQALLYVSGRSEYANDVNNPAPQTVDFANIALVTHSIVAELQDIPPQPLIFKDDATKTLRKEDALVAYSWRRYLENPKANAYWPLQLPMTQAVIMAMDIVQQHADHPIEHFVVSGVSKRGWATWLAVLADPKERINAIIPIVIDILNTKENIHHLHEVYKNNPNSYQGWPHALMDYIHEGIDQQIDQSAFDQLMQILDPIQYTLCGENCEVYKKRLSIPKYIISAGNDDFFAPDSLGLYFSKLPGNENFIRIFPNQGHNIDLSLVESAIISYYSMILNKQKLPYLDWGKDGDGFVINKVFPLNIINNQAAINAPEVTLWEATSSNRDFRLHIPGNNVSPAKYVSRIIFLEEPPDIDIQRSFAWLLWIVEVAKPHKGEWKSYFVEMTFAQPDGSLFTMTTPAYVIDGD